MESNAKLDYYIFDDEEEAETLDVTIQLKSETELCFQGFCNIGTRTDRVSHRHSPDHVSTHRRQTCIHKT